MSTDTTTINISQRTNRAALIRRIGFSMLAVLPFLVIPASPFDLRFVWDAPASLVSVATSAAVMAILAYAVGMLIRFLDLSSAGHGALFGVGAYASGIAMDSLGVSFEVGLLFAIVGAVVVGALMGALALRTAGLAFLIITIALGELVVLIIRNWDSLTEGPLGLFVTQTPTLFGISFSTGVSRYYLALLFLICTIAVVWLVSVSQFGARLIAIRHNESLAKSLGLNTFNYKLAAFVLSAGIAGLSGHLYLMHLKAINPELFHSIAVIAVFLMIVMGGVRSIVGPAVGAWFVVFLPLWFEPLGLKDPTRQEIVFGLLLIGFMLFAPAGLMGFGSWIAARLAPSAPARTQIREILPVQFRRSTRGRRSGSVTREEPVGEVLLTLKGVKKSFRGVAAVGGVSLDVARGEIVGVIGPNGSGKTTLVNCVSGFLAATGGEIIWKGTNVAGKRPDDIAKRGIVRTFQQSMSFPSYTPREHCELLWAVNSGGECRYGLDSVDDVLALFALSEVADTPSSSLPYGHVSNLGLAAAMSTQLPELLMLDEPAAGLSTVETQRLQEHLLELRRRGLTILIIDHDMSFLMPMCDRVVVLDAGKKISEGTPAEVQNDPRVVAAYLGERFAERMTRNTEGSE